MDKDMSVYVNDIFDDIEEELYSVLGRLNALRMDIDGGQSIQEVKREWQSLTDNEISEASFQESGEYAYKFARAIEAKLRAKNT